MLLKPRSVKQICCFIIFLSTLSALKQERSKYMKFRFFFSVHFLLPADLTVAIYFLSDWESLGNYQSSSFPLLIPVSSYWQLEKDYVLIGDQINGILRFNFTFALSWKGMPGVLTFKEQEGDPSRRGTQAKVTENLCRSHGWKGWSWIH